MNPKPCLEQVLQYLLRAHVPVPEILKEHPRSLGMLVKFLQVQLALESQGFRNSRKFQGDKYVGKGRNTWLAFWGLGIRVEARGSSGGCVKSACS
jgi:hypothetical protein